MYAMDFPPVSAFSPSRSPSNANSHGPSETRRRSVVITYKSKECTTQRDIQSSVVVSMLVRIARPTSISRAVQRRVGGVMATAVRVSVLVCLGLPLKGLLPRCQACVNLHTAATATAVFSRVVGAVPVVRKLER